MRNRSSVAAAYPLGTPFRIAANLPMICRKYLVEVHMPRKALQSGICTVEFISRPFHQINVA